MVISSIWAFLLSFPCTTTSSKQPLYSAPRVVAYERVDCTVRYRYLYSFLALFVLLWLKWNSKVPYPAAKVLIVWNTVQMLCLIIKIEKSKGVTWWINFFFLFCSFDNWGSFPSGSKTCLCTLLHTWVSKSENSSFAYDVTYLIMKLYN